VCCDWQQLIIGLLLFNFLPRLAGFSKDGLSQGLTKTGFLVTIDNE